jgi:E3 Ubiquitin ligase
VHTLQLVALVALAISVVVGFIMKMPSASKRGARKVFGQADWLGDDSTDGSLVKTSGVVKVREQGERFVSPLSEDRAVVVRVRVQVRHGVDPRAKLVEDLRIMPFVIEDEAGKILVDAEHALLDIQPIKASRYTLTGKSNLLSELGHETANSAKSEFEETIVAVGANVTVAGTLQKTPELRIVGTKDKPIAIKLERVSNLDAEP